MNRNIRKRRTLTQMKIDKALGSLRKMRKYRAPYIIERKKKEDESGLDFKIL
jgi:hypothetical protein